MTDVGGGPLHNGLRDLTIGHINVIACVRAHESFKLKAMVPESLRGTGL